MGANLVLDTGFAPCYTVYMVRWSSEPLDCRVGDIVVEKVNGQNPTYWVISKVTKNDNPIRFGHTYKEVYDMFNLENDMDTIENVMFRNTEAVTYEIIRG
jgi:hypothetical protein